MGANVGIANTANAVVRGTSAAAPLIPIYALLVISTLDLVGSVTMVTYRYLSDKFLKPLHEKLRTEGREETHRLWAAWNQRRLEAEQNGEPFNEPPPGSNENMKLERKE